jgi:hypothetical protein
MTRRSRPALLECHPACLRAPSGGHAVDYAAGRRLRYGHADHGSDHDRHFAGPALTVLLGELTYLLFPPRSIGHDEQVDDPFNERLR